MVPNLTCKANNDRGVIADIKKNKIKKQKNATCKWLQHELQILKQLYI